VEAAQREELEQAIAGLEMQHAGLMLELEFLLQGADQGPGIRIH